MLVPAIPSEQQEKELTPLEDAIEMSGLKNAVPIMKSARRGDTTLYIGKKGILVPMSEVIKVARQVDSSRKKNRKASRLPR